MDDKELAQHKEIELYAAGAGAWINTALELDKSLLALSAGGLALLITLLTTGGISEISLLILYFAALLSFLVCIVAVLGIFRRNQAHVEQVIVSGNPAPDPFLTILDRLAVSAFGLGAIFTAIIGISTAAASYSGRGDRMTTDQKFRVLADQLGKSLNNLGSLQARPPVVEAQPTAPVEVVPQAQVPAQTPAGQASSASSSSSGAGK